MEGLSETTFRIYMVIAAMGTVLAAAYLLWLFQRTAFGEPTAEFGGSTSDSHGHDDHSDHDDAHHSDIHDVTIYEWVAWTPLLIGIVLFGVMPNLLFKLIDPAVAAIVTQIGG
jgi:NADH-quinone oxidoreductase subunit M